jgi:hypothetical protein
METPCGVSGFLPGGMVLWVDASKSLLSVIAKVRRIGVAVITKMCGGVSFFSHSFERCFTPIFYSIQIITNSNSHHRHFLFQTKAF